MDELINYWSGTVQGKTDRGILEEVSCPWVR